MGSIAWKIFLLLKQIDLNLEKDMMYLFFKISGKNIKEERTTIKGELNIQPCSRRSKISHPPSTLVGFQEAQRDLQLEKTKTAIEDGMDHFTLSASKNTKEWSTDVGGYGNLANEFMQTPECHAVVDTWTSIVRKHQLA
ncbi:uncharacterized protein LOC123471430, partial [Daphnia magna]